MKIAITADVHLHSKEVYSERYNALVNILDQMITENIKILVIAGDLFDKESQNYSEFDELCKLAKYNEIKIYIIPGNHDPGINSKSFVANNVQIFTKPAILQLGEPALDFFFLPYMLDKSMGEIITKYKNDLSEQWVLIGHGDYLSGILAPNPYEPGIYMPLSRADVELFNPIKVILGHIHKKMDTGRIYYVGSPCGLNINETGKRSFLIVDTNNLDISTKTVDTDHIFFNETLIALPTIKESDYIKNKISDMIKKWEISKIDIPKVRIRLKVKGYTSDKGKLLSIIKDSFTNFAFYEGEEPDLTEVSIFKDPERIQIVEKLKEEIE
ncbi:unnamed protein product, partial [marine sediment metagenome]